ncbi:MAG TPA: SOS response-associated peptidase [Bacilli bacterium]|nr:MAG: putative SOS response-associated peptidase YedK [Tenericutes bacterium ADurb.BinA124]HPX84634.1 SOS response-associated peptidase [Bacilli bacterium]HQC74295.1 SOS response-associated peptidase [Bacilli bacterium]
MCGRFSLNKTLGEVTKFLYDYFSIETNFIFSPKYNIAPSQLIIAIIYDGNKYRSGLINWGLETKLADKKKTIINARCETLLQRPLFTPLLLKKRCLVLADGFFEWQKPNQTPHYCFLKDRSLFTMAGLWNTYCQDNDNKTSSCAIITTVANQLMAPIHQRMPVILDEQNRKNWLNPKEQNGEKLISLLQPFPDQQMDYYPVSPLVNNPKNDFFDIIKPHNTKGVN